MLLGGPLLVAQGVRADLQQDTHGRACPAQSPKYCLLQWQPSILYSAHAPCDLLQAVCGHSAQCYTVRCSICRSVRHTASCLVSKKKAPDCPEFHIFSAACRRQSCAGCRSAAGNWTRRQSSQGAHPATGVLQPCGAVQLASSSRTVRVGGLAQQQRRHNVLPTAPLRH